ncbi:MAG TPA: folylpolyglutamate synthase/dihydrofolate synthase family protein [Bacteroidales bacterium]|nr:folylpolyglutamate synthase/dihydrofolate synthase family protein [Bacteroidales bacterium]HOL98928.1 folylpolyglutamate synthase/dihydrofolate synthase family protein [Bacteroidales bacterium]HOM36890.1 folylpolyglutamate synthase/dihydrofolate synthase family protein [Bacteroidales bacterium]HPD24210.1 folylpolyglutamate synthase/dihydrofolate synthase family protein [Bacteroidales bacterium]HRS99895.1 folylpolyglutamate synthase/dihydrofolate synthase family protein [Bacteroidales bacteri
MNYEEVLKFMYESLPMYQRIGAAAYKADLNTTIKLDDYFGNPHKHYKTIHIAGTNGKGSVSHSLASVLQEAGYKTGLYTSPHLVDYRERIRVNGEKISKEFVTDFINNNLKVLKELKPSFFEMSVALAFEYFRFMKVDIAVIEVGMGGRLDSTNIINPIISVITNIDYDHTQFLGDTKEKIAVEKAGIIKPKVPVIIGESSPETDNVFLQKAKSENSRILFADKISTCEQIKSDFENSIYRFSKNGISNEFNFALGGNYQHKNLNLIINAVECINDIGVKINDDSLANGLKNVVKNTSFRGRWEKLNDNPLCVCDTGHNKNGITEIIKQIKNIKADKYHFVLGFVSDKNVSELLELFPNDERNKYYFTQASIPRAMSIEDLKNIVITKCFSQVSFYSNVPSAYNAAMSSAGENDFVFVGGSNFVVGEIVG